MSEKDKRLSRTSTRSVDGMIAKQSNNLHKIKIDSREFSTGKGLVFKVNDKLISDSNKLVISLKSLYDKSVHGGDDEESHIEFIEDELKGYLNQLLTLTKQAFLRNPTSFNQYQELLNNQYNSLSKYNRRQFSNKEKYDYEIAKEWTISLSELQAELKLIQIRENINEQTLLERFSQDDYLEFDRSKWTRELPSVGSAVLQKQTTSEVIIQEKADYMCYDKDDNLYLAIELKSTFRDWSNLDVEKIIRDYEHYKARGIEYRLRIVRPSNKDSDLKGFFNDHKESKFKTKSEWKNWWSKLMKELVQNGVPFGYYLIDNKYGSSPSLKTSDYLRYNERCNLIADRIITDSTQPFTKTI
jgi:hypothetical protein